MCPGRRRGVGAQAAAEDQGAGARPDAHAQAAGGAGQGGESQRGHGSHPGHVQGQIQSI